MHFHETLKRRTVPALALIGVLAMNACSGDTTPDEEAQDQAKEVASSTKDHISEPQYLPDGRRVTIIPTLFRDHLLEPIVMTEFCGGPNKSDLVTVTEQASNNGAAGGVDRSINHPACEDGILTIDDETSYNR